MLLDQLSNVWLPPAKLNEETKAFFNVQNNSSRDITLDRPVISNAFKTNFTRYTLKPGEVAQFTIWLPPQSVNTMARGFFYFDTSIKNPKKFGIFLGASVYPDSKTAHKTYQTIDGPLMVNGVTTLDRTIIDGGTLSLNQSPKEIIFSSAGYDTFTLNQFVIFADNQMIKRINRVRFA